MTNPEYTRDNTADTASSSASQPDQASQPARVNSPANPHGELSATERKVLEDYEKNKTRVKGSFAASTWAALIVGFLLLILLIVFILQNQQSVELNFFSWTGHFPAGIAFLIFTVAGALIMALVGGWRMFELRRQVRKARKAAGESGIAKQKQGSK